MGQALRRARYDIFDKVIQEKLAIQKDGLYLYRNIIPPHVPDVAFIGSEVSSGKMLVGLK